MYMHRNPVTRGLVTDSGDWRWSSYQHYLTGERGVVEIESEVTGARRDRAAFETQVSEARPHQPSLFRMESCTASNLEMSKIALRITR